MSATERLCITLRFLGTDDSFTTISVSYKVGVSTVAFVVQECCIPLWEILQPLYLPAPDMEKWQGIALRFWQRWQFPNCIGAIDGKHCVIQAPPNSGSMYFNYKGTFSIVLMALVDADYCFTVVDIGKYDRNSDGGIFRESALGQGLANNTLGVPDEIEIPNAPNLGRIPHVIVGDPAFPLKTYLMRPFPGKNLDDDKLIFNYRLSRARRISENAFGILTQKWTVYQRRINLHHAKAVQVVKATVVLHNFIIQGNQNNQENLDEDGRAPRIDGGHSDALENIPALVMGGQRPNGDAKMVRETFKEFFCGPSGELAFQYAMIRH